MLVRPVGVLLLLVLFGLVEWLRSSVSGNRNPSVLLSLKMSDCVGPVLFVRRASRVSVSSSLQMPELSLCFGQAAFLSFWRPLITTIIMLIEINACPEENSVSCVCSLLGGARTHEHAVGTLVEMRSKQRSCQKGHSKTL